MVARRLRWWLPLAMLAWTTASGAASAEPTDEEIAKAKLRFEEGKAFEDAEKWSEALDAFKDVASVKMTPQVRFQIAFCEENLGHLVAALRGYEEAVTLAQKDEERAKEVLKAAPIRSSALKARVPRLTLEVGGPGADKTRFAVLIDDAPVEAGSLRAPIELDAGSHTIDLELASGDGKEKKHVADVALAERQEKTVRIDVPLAPEREPRAGSGEAPPSAARAKTGTKIPAIVVGSAGIASLVTSGILLGLRQDAISRVRDTCKGRVPDTGCDPSVQGVADDGRNYTYASASLAVVGVAALGAATALWFTVGASSPGAPAPASVVVSPSFVGVATRF